MSALSSPASSKPAGSTPPVAPKRHLTGAASKSYSVASAWEKSAALNDQELQLVEALAAAASQRPCPPHVSEDAAAAPPQPQPLGAPGSGAGVGGVGSSTGDADADADADAAAASYAGTLEDAVLGNAHQFHKWHAELEAARASETEQKYQQYGQLLHRHLTACDAIQARIDATMVVFDQLLQLHRDVTGRSAALASSCEALVAEKTSLVEFGDSLRARLRFFDELEAVGEQFNALQTAAPDDDTVLRLLRRLDDCIAWVGANPQYADSVAYAARFKQLQLRVLSTVKNHVQQVLRGAVAQVVAGVTEAAGGGGTRIGGGLPSSPLKGAASGGASAAGVGGGVARTGSGALVNGVPVLPEGAEVSLLYVRFRAAAEPSLKGLFTELEARAARPEYARLLRECRALYCSARQQLVAPFTAQRVAALAHAPLLQLLRGGCEQLVRLAAAEGALVEHFFPSRGVGSVPATPAAPTPRSTSSGGGGGASGGGAGGGGVADLLRPLLEPLATQVYDALRPRVVALSDVDELCELIDLLQQEVLCEQVARRGGALDALAPMLLRTLADLQGRLIYRCQALIKEQVAAYTPTPTDVDFPGRLERAAAAAAARSGSGALERVGSSNGISEIGEGGLDADPPASEPLLAGASEPDALAEWYPPLRSTLLLLSKLYRAVDPRIFSGLAQEAVAAATQSVQQAGRLVARSNVLAGGAPPAGAGAPPPANGAGAAGPGAGAAQPNGAAGGALVRAPSGLPLPLAGQLDAHLYVIKHLLFLREQIAPFDVDFAATDVDLDFSHMRDHMRRILAGEASLFTLGSNNAMVQMLGRGGPRVVAAQLDSKRELEAQLKAACEGFIMASTKVGVEPLLAFLTKVTAVRVAAAAKADGSVRPLKEQAFASPAKLADLVGRVNTALATALPQVVAKAQLYLPNPNTRAILFRPVKSNIAEAHGQVAGLLEAEYSPEEAATVPLMQPGQLGAVLDALA